MYAPVHEQAECRRGIPLRIGVLRGHGDGFDDWGVYKPLCAGYVGCVYGVVLRIYAGLGPSQGR